MAQIVAFLRRMDTWTAVAVLALVGWLIDSLLWYLETHPFTLTGFGTFLVHSWYALPLLAAIFIILRLRQPSELLSLTIYDERGAPIYRQGNFRLEDSVLEPLLTSSDSTSHQHGFHHIGLSTGSVIYFLRQSSYTLVACFSGPPQQAQLKAGLRLLETRATPAEALLQDLPLDVAALTIPLLNDPVARDLLVYLWTRRRIAMTPASLAGQMQYDEAEVVVALDKLERLRLVQHRKVLDLTFYRLTDDEVVLTRLDQFITWRSEWLNRAYRVEQIVGTASHSPIHIK